GPLRHPLDKIRPIQAAVCAGDPRWSRLFSGDSHDVENVVGVIDARTALAIKNPRGTPGSSILRSTKGTTNAGNLLPLGPLGDQRIPLAPPSQASHSVLL